MGRGIAPHVEYVLSINKTKKYITLSVENNGMGPAIIKSLKIEGVCYEQKYEEEIHKKLFSKLNKILKPNCDFYSIGLQGFYPEYSLSPNKSCDVITINWDQVDEIDNYKIKAVLETINMELTYGDSFGNVEAPIMWTE